MVRIGGTNKIDCCVWIALVIFVSLLDKFCIDVLLRRGNFVSVIEDTRFLSELLDGHFLGNSFLIGGIYFVMLCLC